MSGKHTSIQKSQRYSAESDLADPKLYRTYWRLCLEDILLKLGYEPTKENKHILHEFHKRILGYDSTSGRSQKIVSSFIQEVCLLWAEQGIFVRTNKHQPFWIELMDFRDEVQIEGKTFYVWQLL